MRIEHVRGNSALTVVVPFAAHLEHFFFVSRDPDRSTLFVLDVFGQFGSQLLPQLLGVARQRKLRFGIIHDNDVPHPGGSGAASDNVAVDHHHAQATTREFVRTRRAHDAGAHNRNIMAGFAHARIPMQSGSRGSSTNSASAFTNADPLMLGYTLPSRTFTLPSTTLPTILSCFQVWPSRILPSA